ncbi:uncharacterized protein TNCV_82601 [Trichonephila clavipes]|nr:uncharacterized protein TNCV_82601 [Trichonephila clavipes]
MPIFKYVSKNCYTSAASYSAANTIARHGKPFQEEEFLKEAWLACAPSLFDDFDNKDKIIQHIKDVPLSRNTMKDRILKLAENVTDQQKNDINSAPFISLCLDESIDITKSVRLAVFARYCVGNIIKEELIAITSLLKTTKGTDICTATLTPSVWARKLSIVPATSYEYTATSAELGNINIALLAAKERMNLPLFRLPISIEALDALIKKVEEQRAHLIPVDSTPKETVPSHTTLNSPSKRTLKNLRLKTDKERLIDDDGFQTPDKRHTTKKIDKKNPSLPPTTSQTSNPAQALPPPAESSDSEIEDEDTGKSNPTAVGTPQNQIPPIFVNPPDNWCIYLFIKILFIIYLFKLLIHGLPTSTKIEEIRVEIEREGFQIHKISRLQKFKTKAPMPLIYLQLVNDAKVDTIFQFTEMFGTQISPLSAMTIVAIKDPINAGDARVFSILRKSAISQLNALNAQGLTRLKTVIVHLKTH